MGRKSRRIPNLEQVVLTDIGNKGKAVGRHNDRVVFVTGGVPGDVVDVQVTKKRRSYLEGKAIRFHEMSSDRVEAKCVHFGVCGGCKWQALDYKKQVEYKQKEVEQNLRKIGHISPETTHPILPSEEQYYYRNKLEFSFTDNKWLTQDQLDSGVDFPERRGVGFHIPGFWDKVLDISECHLQAEPTNAIRNFIKDWAIERDLPFFNPRSQDGWLRTMMIRVTSIGEVLLLIQFRTELATERQDLLNALLEKFPQITSLYYVINEKGNDTIYDLDLELFHGTPQIQEHMPRFSGEGAPLKFLIGPKSFYQTNSKQAGALYSVAAEMAQIKKTDLVFDLYTGTGTIALFMADLAKEVVGIELIPEAIADAKKNAEANGITNATFYAGDMKMVLNDAFVAKHGKPDVLVTDPPREGMHGEVVDFLLQLEVPKVVYISCNSATQARDLALLSEKYEVKQSRAVDMFPQTHHIENVVELVLKV
ncbi:MAG: tRNA (uracil-5-)-methyltransferase [Bacteroidota bacterium]